MLFGMDNNTFQVLTLVALVAILLLMLFGTYVRRP